MRLLLAALAALLCCPAVAAAAPWAEPPFHPLGGDRAATCLHAAGLGRVAVVGTGDDDRERVELLRVAADGAPAPEGVVRLGRSPQCPSVAAAGSGAAVAAVGTIARRGMALAVATRDAGGGFGAPLRVPAARRGTVFDARAALASSGAAVVSWTELSPRRRRRGDAVRLRVMRRPSGGAFGAAETLRRGIDVYAAPAIGIDDAGRATVAWLSQAGDDRTIEVATAAPGEAFGAPQRLTRNDADGPPTLAVAADGGALLAYEAARGVRIFERAPGATPMTRGPAYPTSRERARPVVALAPGGGAIVAWRGQVAVPVGFDPTVEVALRAPGGAFQPPRALSATTPGAAGWKALAPLPAFEPVEDDGALNAAVGADGAAVVGWLEAPVIAGGDDPARVALAAGTLAGGWEGTMLLGGPGRSADGLAVLAAPAAVLWTDNLPDFASDLDEPDRSGRLHRALAGAVAPPDPAAPSLTLRARRQRVGFADPVIVAARCSAACDLRAGAGNAAGIGAAQLDGPGAARIELHPSTVGDRLVPRRGRPLRVTVHATAPGGRKATVARIDVRVRAERP